MRDTRGGRVEGLLLLRNNARKADGKDKEKGSSNKKSPPGCPLPRLGKVFTPPFTREIR